MVGKRHLSPALSSQRPRPILFLLDHGIRPQHLAQHVHPADRRQERRTLCQRHPWHALLGRQKTPPGPEHCSRSNDRRVPHRRRRPHTLIYKPRTGPQGPSDTHRAYIRETRRPPIAPARSSSRTTIPLPMADQGRSPSILIARSSRTPATPGNRCSPRSPPMPTWKERREMMSGFGCT